jgi:prepilin-type N-terminal cleavage/methylation domain-containing protein
MQAESMQRIRVGALMTNKPNSKTATRKAAGFSLIELVVVIGVLTVVAAMAIPSWIRMQKNARLSGDAHNIASVLSIAKMRAAANFTESRVFFFTGSDKKQYVRIDVWNKTANTGGTGCWVPDAVNSPAASDCITDSSYKHSETFLSTGVSAGYGSVSTSPDSNVALGQPGSCLTGQTLPWLTTGGATQISNTSCIQFNSSGFPTSGAAFYITDGTRVFSLMTNAMGFIHTYGTSDNGQTWKAQ